MNLYLDSSALLRRYLKRLGGEELSHELETAGRYGIAAITRVEVAAALTRLERGGVIHRGERRNAFELLEHDLPVMTEIFLTQDVVTRAYELVQKHGLRGYDGIQLAAADFWRVSLEEPVTIATFDADLWSAANSDNFLVWPPDLSVFK